MLLRVTTVNLTAVDLKDINKNDVNSASSHTLIITVLFYSTVFNYMFINKCSLDAT